MLVGGILGDGISRVRQLLETRETRSPGSQGPGQAGRQAGRQASRQAGGQAGGQAGRWAGRQAGRQASGVKQAGRWVSGRKAAKGLSRQVGMREKGRKETKRNSKQIDSSTFACICSSSICIKNRKSTYRVSKMQTDK
jgi:hypothetical protein